jgi:hypothetical protein
MNSSELLTLFRTEVQDTERPYLWSDEDIFAFEDDAQLTFCRKTDGISDATTTAVTTIAVVPTTDWVDLHESILKIRSARRSDTGAPIEVLNEEDMAERGLRFDGRTGPVKVLVIGAEAHKARVWPVSNETVSIRLTVFRLPLEEITSDGDQAFEIDREHHRHLMWWMKYLAYSKDDVETYNKTKAAEAETKFFAYCAQVAEEERRKRHKTRIVRYGGV